MMLMLELYKIVLQQLSVEGGNKPVNENYKIEKSIKNGSFIV